MKQYLDLLNDVMKNGRFKMDRTGVGCYSVFGRQVRFNLMDGFPLVTTKKVHLPSIIHELLWFLKGSRNIAYLKENKVKIWDAWALTDPPTHLMQKSRGERFEQYAIKHGMDVEQVREAYAAYVKTTEGIGTLDAFLNDADELIANKPIILEGDLGPVYGEQWRSWPSYTTYHFYFGDRPLPDIYLFSGRRIRDKGIIVPMPSEVNNDNWREWAVDYIRKKQDTKLGHFTNTPITGPNGDLLGYTVITQLAIDQIATLIRNLKTNPFSRRHVVSAWNPADMPEEGKSHRENVLNNKQALPPCHALFQFFVEEMTLEERTAAQDLGDPAKILSSYCTYGEDETPMKYENAELQDSVHNSEYSIELYRLFKSNGDSAGLAAVYVDHMAEVFDEKNDPVALGRILDLIGTPDKRLSCQLYQRSADAFLGVPFNIASYALFTMMVAQVCNMAPGEFIHTFGDLHIYSNHVEKVKMQLEREPHMLPSMYINPEVRNIFDFKFEDFVLQNYNHHEEIKAAVAV